MGRTNQRRRAAKKRKKQQRRRAPRGGGDGLPPVDELVRAAALAWGADDDCHDALVRLGVALLALLSRLGSLPTTVPAPGQAAAGVDPLRRTGVAQAAARVTSRWWSYSVGVR